MPTTPTPPLDAHRAAVDFYGTPLEAIADALNESYPRLMCDGLQYDVAREALAALTHTFTLHLRESAIADLWRAGHLPPGPAIGVHPPDLPPGIEPVTPQEAAALDDIRLRARQILVSPALIGYRLGHADGRACLELPTDLIAPEPAAPETGVAEEGDDGQ